MYSIKEFDESMDLSSFYKTAMERGFVNNINQKVMIDTFKKERDYKAWILFEDDNPIGSVVTHTLDILGPTAYRICARTCTFAEARPSHGLITVKRLIEEHQNLTDQIFIPTMIDYLGHDKDMYISSHPSTVGTQRMVHNIYCPTLVKKGLLTNHGEFEYRGHVQTFWKLDSVKFLEDLKKYPRWV
jgi:hypothetical protein